MNWRGVVLSLVLGVSLGWSQRVISVDSSVSRNAQKSLLGALAFSAVVPGGGQYYLGEKKRVRPYVWTDAALWMACAGSWFVGQQQLSSARDYAVRYADASGLSRNAELLDVVGNYRSRSGVQYQNSSPDADEDYNQAMIRAGSATDATYSKDIVWDWGSSDNPATSEHMAEYNKMLKHYRLSRIAFQVSIGALVLNRVVSMLDVLRIYRATSSTDLTQNLQIMPVFEPDRNGAQVNVPF
jgi:hypothetical protein